MEIRCPHCDQSLEIQLEHLGCEVTCPTCSKDFTIPAPATAPQDDTIECPFCAEPIKPNARKCRHCGEFLDGSKPTQEDKPVKPSKTPVCQQCGGSMRKTTLSSGNCSGIVIALIALIIGIVVTFAVPVAGWIIGPIICIGALFMGGKRRKVWKCKNCGSVVNRA